MGCGSEPNETTAGAMMVTSSARVQPTCERVTPEDTSASERTRAHAQRDVTFLEKAKVPLQLDTGPRKSLSPAPEEVLC